MSQTQAVISTRYAPNAWTFALGRQLLLEEFADDPRLLAARDCWYGQTVVEQRWFTLRLRAGRESSSDSAESRYVFAVEQLCEELGLRGDWCPQAVHQMLGSSSSGVRLIPFYMHQAGEGPGPRRSRPSRRFELENSVRWLASRLRGCTTREIAGYARLSVDVSEPHIRQQISRTARLLGIELRGRRRGTTQPG